MNKRIARKIKSILNLSLDKPQLLGTLHQTLLDAKHIKEAQNFTHLFMFTVWVAITGSVIVFTPIPAIFVILAFSSLLLLGALICAFVCHEDNSDAYDKISGSIRDVLPCNPNKRARELEIQKTITYLQDAYADNSNFIPDLILEDIGNITSLRSTKQEKSHNIKPI